jgi:hypothetical protein
MGIFEETMLTITAAAKSCPGGGRHTSTLNRWIKIGLNGVRLETIFIGGRRWTSKEALERFNQRLTAIDVEKYKDT